MKNYQVAVTVYVPDVEAEDDDEAINFVTEAIEDAFDRPVVFDRQQAITYGE